MTYHFPVYKTALGGLASEGAAHSYAFIEAPEGFKAGDAVPVGTDVWPANRAAFDRGENRLESSYSYYRKEN